MDPNHKDLNLYYTKVPHIVITKLFVRQYRDLPANVKWSQDVCDLHNSPLSGQPVFIILYRGHEMDLTTFPLFVCFENLHLKVFFFNVHTLVCKIMKVHVN